MDMKNTQRFSHPEIQLPSRNRNLRPMRFSNRPVQAFASRSSLLLLILFLQACQGQQTDTITGTIQLSEDWKPVVYLLKPKNFSAIAGDYLSTVVDSAMIQADGSFILPHPVESDTSMLYMLAIQKKGSKYANHLDDEYPAQANYMPLVISSNQPTNIRATAANFQQSFSVENLSAENEALEELRNLRIDAHKQWVKELENDTHEDEYIILREEAYQRYTKVLRDFAANTSSFYAALVAIRWVSPTGDFERQAEFIHTQCKKWEGTQPDHPFTVELCALAEKESLPVMLGDIIPDFQLPMVNGDSVSLHALLGSQLTILDIWASWCAPCRKENREVLAPLYEEYKAKGLNIIGYALDSGEKPWKAAIEKDGAVWDHASHLQGDQSPFMEALRISTIPANYILDSEGKILAKNLHGDELTNFVQERFD